MHTFYAHVWLEKQLQSSTRSVPERNVLQTKMDQMQAATDEIFKTRLVKNLKEKEVTL